MRRWKLRYGGAVTPVGLRPPFVTAPPQSLILIDAESHLDCRRAFPESGTVIAPRPIMIMDWSKDQEDAKKFVDYVLSDEGQTIVAEQNLMPARADVAAERPLIADLKILPV